MSRSFNAFQCLLNAIFRLSYAHFALALVFLTCSSASADGLFSSKARLSSTSLVEAAVLKAHV